MRTKAIIWEFSAFMLPKRRFGKTDQTFGNVFSKHFSNERQIEYSTMWETTFPRNSHAGLGKPFYEPSMLVNIL